MLRTASVIRPRQIRKIAIGQTTDRTAETIRLARTEGETMGRLTAFFSADGVGSPKSRESSTDRHGPAFIRRACEVAKALFRPFARGHQGEADIPGNQRKFDR